MPATELGPLIHLESPYPGLRPFESDEAFLFFGRRKQIDELLRQLSTNRFLAVVGTSGSGKSSLVRAGLLPALYRGFLTGGISQWRIALMKPGDAPMASLAKALNGQNIPTEELSRSSLGLVECVKRAKLHPAEGLLIVADQFEELFRFREQQTDGGAEAKLFAASLLEGVDSFPAPIYVVLTMRSDFLGDCTQFPNLPEALNRSQYLIPRLAREQRRQAIEKPARLVDATVAPRLVQRLLNELGDDPDQLPLLQHALNRTFWEWKKAGAQGDIDFKHYEEAKTLEGALNDHADAVLLTLPETARPWTEKIFRCLTTTLANGRVVRRPTTLEDIYRVAGIQNHDTDSKAQVRLVIEEYARRNNSMLICSPAAELTTDTVVDISHESLIARWRKLKAWVEQEAHAARWYRSAAEDAVRYERGQSGTWRDPKLALAMEMAEKGPWNKAWANRDFADCGIEFGGVRGFLDQGVVDQRKERLRSRVGWSIIVALLVVAFIAMAAVASEREKAVQARDEVILLQKKASDLDGQLHMKEAEKSDLENQLKQAGLPDEKRKTLQTSLDAASENINALKAQSAVAEKKLQEGERQAQAFGSERTRQEQRIASLQTERDKFKFESEGKDGKIKNLEEALKNATKPIQPTLTPSFPPAKFAFLVGEWEAQIKGNQYVMRVEWDKEGNYLKGYAATLGAEAAKVGFVKEEHIWTVLPIGEPDSVIELQKWRDRVTGRVGWDIGQVKKSSDNALVNTPLESPLTIASKSIEFIRVK